VPKCIKSVHVVHLLVFLYLANATFLVAEAFRWIVPEKEKQIEMCALYEMQGILSTAREIYISEIACPGIATTVSSRNMNVHENIRKMKIY